jgi:hypothetical protein
MIAIILIILSVIIFSGSIIFCSICYHNSHQKRLCHSHHPDFYARGRRKKRRCIPQTPEEHAIRRQRRVREAALSRPFHELFAEVSSHGQVETNSLRYAQTLFGDLRVHHANVTMTKVMDDGKHVLFYRITCGSAFKPLLKSFMCADVESIVMDYIR